MNARLHHTPESGSNPTAAHDSPRTEEPRIEPSPGRRISELEDDDLAASLQYNQCRRFDPTPGRWISDEPNGFGASDENLTKYVGQ